MKIADYGLASFYELNVVELWFAKKKPEFFTSLLWTSPELLRDCEKAQRDTGLLNKATDVYSFGIILQELMLWSRAYSMFPDLQSTGWYHGTFRRVF